jgi:hypothetical protein
MNETSPAVAGSESGQQYLVIWTRPVELPPPNPPFVGIFGQSISTGGAYVGDVSWIAGLFVDDSAIANGPAGDTLIAYEDEPGSGVDIWGVLLGNRIYLPLVVK